MGLILRVGVVGVNRCGEQGVGVGSKVCESGLYSIFGGQI